MFGKAHDSYGGVDASDDQTCFFKWRPPCWIQSELAVVTLPGVPGSVVVQQLRIDNFNFHRLADEGTENFLMKMSLSTGGEYSACAARPRPSTFLAISMNPCWNPAQVPKNGNRRSRAHRIPSKAPFGLRQGLPGAHQTAEAFASTEVPAESIHSVPRWVTLPAAFGDSPRISW